MANLLSEGTRTQAAGCVATCYRVNTAEDRWQNETALGRDVYTLVLSAYFWYLGLGDFEHQNVLAKTSAGVRYVVNQNSDGARAVMFLSASLT